MNLVCRHWGALHPTSGTPYKQPKGGVTRLGSAGGGAAAVWTISVSGAADLAAARLPEGIAAVCVDRKTEGAVGGTGQTFDWTMLKGFAPGVPLWLAGGINEDNVARPAGHSQTKRERLAHGAWWECHPIDGISTKNAYF